MSKATHKSTEAGIRYDSDGRIIENIYWAIASVGHDEDYVPRKMPRPTNAIAGTAEKIEVLRRRVLAGEHLFHPDDNHAIAAPCERREIEIREVPTFGLQGRVVYQIRLPRVL